MKLSIMTKLLGLLMLVFLGFGLLVAVVLHSFENIEKTVTGTVTHDVNQNIGDALLLNDLSAVFSDTNLLVSTFFRNDAFLRSKSSELLTQARSIEHKSTSLPLKESVRHLTERLEQVFAQCGRVNAVLHRSDTLEQNIESTLTSLERTVSDKKISHVLEGQDPIFLEQLGVLISGYRETFLQITAAFLRTATNPSSEGSAKIIRRLDSLQLRFQTLTASEPQIARYGPELMALAQAYRAAIIEYYDAINELRQRLASLEQAKAGVLSVTNEIDGHISASATGMTTRIAGVVGSTRSTIFGMAAAGFIILGFVAVAFLLTTIRKPMTAIRKSLERIQAGDLSTRISLNRSDEWTDLEQAVNRMTAELQESYAALTGKNTELQYAQRTLELKISELEREIEARKRAEDESKKLEEQLRQSQKMEAVGTLAGGVAHDFNNMLTAIIGYGNMALLTAEPESRLERYLRQMLTAADRGAALTNSLLAFSRGQVIAPQTVDLNVVVRSFETLLQQAVGDSVRFDLRLCEQPATTVADSSQIQQSLFNLALNARDAMPDGGVFEIRTEVRRITDQEARELGLVSSGLFVELRVTDNGTGMDSATLQRIFEPFFTTKATGKGTGLGLAMVYGIVKQHRGIITARSEQGNGSSFSIVLPYSSAPVAAENESSHAEPRGGTETILLAEDQGDVRGFVRGLLEQYGYRVHEAVNGAEAVELFMVHAPEIDILLFDVMMPVKNGRDALEEIQREAPHIKAIFMSGYTGDMLKDNGVVEKNRLLLTKPVSPWHLLNTVREVLDSQASGAAD